MQSGQERELPQLATSCPTQRARYAGQPKITSSIVRGTARPAKTREETHRARTTTSDPLQNFRKSMAPP
eukprot:1428432-Pyramimonas_sp.AAC.1